MKEESSSRPAASFQEVKAAPCGCRILAEVCGPSCESFAPCRRSASSATNQTSPWMHPLQHPVVSAASVVGATLFEVQRDGEEQVTNGNYLCSEVSVYSTEEPCLMCSMALLHSRVAAVFFGVKPTTEIGGFTAAKLNLDRRLNHPFRAFARCNRGDILRSQSKQGAKTSATNATV